MVNPEILDGLRSAVNKGESLQKAMMTFYNSGYKKEEIEEAAHIVHQEKIDADIIFNESAHLGGAKEEPKKQEPKQMQEKTMPQPPQQQTEVKPAQMPQQPVLAQSQMPQQPKPLQQASQQVSAYQQKPKKKMSKGLKLTLIIVIVVAVLFGLFALLSGYFELF